MIGPRLKCPENVALYRRAVSGHKLGGTKFVPRGHMLRLLPGVSGYQPGVSGYQTVTKRTVMKTNGFDWPSISGYLKDMNLIGGWQDTPGV